jgi:hypothetical protein
MNPEHEHDWAPLRSAVTGQPSKLMVCRVEGCTELRFLTAQAEPDDGEYAPGAPAHPGEPT